MNKIKTKNILFDLGNVLIDLDQDLWRQEMKDLFDIISLKDLHPVVVEKMKDYERGIISTSIFINHMLRHSPTGTQALDVITAWNSMLVGIKYHRLEALEQLKSRFRLFVLSNTNALHIEWVDKYLMKRLKFPAFYGLFDEIFLSHEIKKSKPTEESFRHVAHTARIKPQETIFFDDSEENIAAAAVLGYQAIHVPKNKEITELIDELGLIDL